MEGEVETLLEWLTKLDLSQYYTNFVSVGLMELEDCLALDADFLNDIGINLLGHRKRILEHLPLINVNKYHEEMNRSKSTKGNPETPPPTSCKGGTMPARKISPPKDNISLPLSKEKPKIDKTVTPTTPPAKCYGAPVASPESSKVTPEPRGKKPVPKPRISKLKKKEELERHKLTRMNSDTSNSFEFTFTENSVTLPDATISESSDVTDPFHGSTSASDQSASAFQFETNFADMSVFNFEQTVETGVKQKFEVLPDGDDIYVNVQTSAEIDDKPSTLGGSGVSLRDNTENKGILSDFDPLAFGTPKRESDTYEAIWVNGGNESEKTNSHTVKHQSDAELATGEMFDFMDDGVYENIEFSHDADTAPSTTSQKSSSNQQQELKPLFSDNFSDISKTQVSQLPRNKSSIPSFQECSGSDGDVSNTESPDVSFDMPPPNFPPPPLPSSQDSNIFPEFDPLAVVKAPKEFPRIPPRKSLKSQDDDYVNYPLQNDQDGLPDYNEVMKNDMIESQLESLVTPQKAKHKPFVTSPTLSTPGPDPFKGMDPFMESEFGDECEQFNIGASRRNTEFTSTPLEGAVGGAEYELAEPVDDTFDPFGLNRESSGRQSGWGSTEGNVCNLDEVPPPPHWNEALEHQGRIYSVARGLRPDLFEDYSPNTHYSTDEDTSDSEIFTIDNQEEECLTPEPSPVSPVIVPSDNLTVRKQYRNGYLYKQGGLKGNKGWRKRWVIFNGKDLRYYANSKSQVSKRIVPVTCMKCVKDAVKSTDTTRFKFNLVTKNRTYQFAAETLNDCLLWSNSLMEAIVKCDNQPPPESGLVGGVMYQPDKQGFIKFERGKTKKYAAIKYDKLCYYKNEQDFNIGSPINEIEMKLASVKEVEKTSFGNAGKHKLQLSTHYGHFYLLFDSYQDCLLWRMAMEEAIANGLGNDTVLDKIKENPSNQMCADCDMPDPHWASINLGMVLCKKCAGIHRNFDRISKVRSLRMDISVWTDSLVQMMIHIGNDNANQFWEAHMDPQDKINSETCSETRKQHLENKYKDKRYCDLHPLSVDKHALNMELLKAASTSDILLTMRLIFSGADVLYKKPGTEDETAFQIAKLAGQRFQMELLLRNGGDLTTRTIEDDEANTTRRRAEVCLSCNLMKTGPDKKEFLQRWCVIEHGCLKYYNNDKSTVANGSISHDTMQCIQATPTYSSKYPEAFELSTKQNQNRIYLFAASSAEEKLTWMRMLSKLMCPVSLMEDVGQYDFSLAGIFYVREGLTMDWQKTWLMLNKKELKYTDKEMKLVDDVDLRKTINIKFQDSLPSSTSPGYVREEGKCFVIDLPGGRALYFRAEIEKDTQRLFKAIQAAKVGGDSLIDQPLTQDDLPIIIDKCVKFIEEHGRLEKGIYREAAQHSKVDSLLEEFAKDAQGVTLQLGEHTVHEVANTLKRFLRNLKDPLLTNALYEQWIEKSQHPELQTRLGYYKCYINQLPLEHKVTLKRLVIHLGRLSRDADTNMMTVKNISIAFGSTLMKAGSEPQGMGTENLQREMHVIGDIITNYEQLFETEKAKEEQYHSKQKDAEDKLRELQKTSEKRTTQTDVESPEQRNDRKSVFGRDPVLMPIHYLDHRNQSDVFNVQLDTTVGSVVSHLKAKWNIKEGTWMLHEVVHHGKLERPLHDTDNLYEIIMAWGDWGSNHSKTATLCLKPSELVEKIERCYDAWKPLFAELKFSDVKKKDFSKFTFDFKQMYLSYYKGSKASSTALKSWNAECLSVYVGAHPDRKLPYKYAFSFVPRGEKIGDREYFGYAISMKEEEEMLSWVAAMMRAKYPNGLLS